MKSILIGSLIFTNIAFAADRGTAYNLVCKKLSMESSKNECTTKIKNYNYFDAGALEICSNLNFDSNKLNCLDRIGNKDYESYEIESCRDQNFESSKMTCLSDNGSLHTQQTVCASKEETLSQLNSSLYDLHTGNFASVENRLNYLINKFNSCK